MSSITWFYRWNFIVRKPLSQFISNISATSTLDPFIFLENSSALEISKLEHSSSSITFLTKFKWLKWTWFIGASPTSAVSPVINSATNGYTISTLWYSFHPYIPRSPVFVHWTFKLLVRLLLRSQPSCKACNNPSQCILKKSLQQQILLFCTSLSGFDLSFEHLAFVTSTSPGGTIPHTKVVNKYLDEGYVTVQMCTSITLNQHPPACTPPIWKTISTRTNSV